MPRIAQPRPPDVDDRYSKQDCSNPSKPSSHMPQRSVSQGLGAKYTKHFGAVETGQSPLSRRKVVIESQVASESEGLDPSWSEPDSEITASAGGVRPLAAGRNFALETALLHPRAVLHDRRRSSPRCLTLPRNARFHRRWPLRSSDSQAVAGPHVAHPACLSNPTHACNLCCLSSNDVPLSFDVTWLADCTHVPTSCSRLLLPATRHAQSSLLRVTAQESLDLRSDLRSSRHTRPHPTLFSDTVALASRHPDSLSLQCPLGQGQESVAWSVQKVRCRCDPRTAPTPPASAPIGPPVVLPPLPQASRETRELSHL